jgi:hypothetical protein
MTTEQQKAEAHVREKLPELVYLPHHVVGPFGSTGSKRGWYYAYADDKGINRHSSVFETKEEAEKHQFATHGQGQPIQLHHWLRVMPEAGETLCWPDKLSLSYAIEGQKTVWFDLTTGQPASEADFKSFNDIVGI